MTHDTDNAPADIAWMRRLAEEGSQAPMQGGSILMTAGLSYGVASIVHWLGATGRMAGVEQWVNYVWFAATGVFFVGLFASIARMKRTAGARTAGNRASGTAWSALGWGIFALFASLAIIGYRADEQTALVLLTLAPSVIMVFYGIGWAVSGAMHRDRTMWGLSAASFVAAPVLALLAGSPTQYIGYAAALIALMALPGYTFMRRAGRAA